MSAPVTPAQRRLWFLAQVEPDALDWHIPLAWRLRGPLDAAALAAALGDVVARHGTLRTRFPLEEGRRGDVLAMIVASLERAVAAAGTEARQRSGVRGELQFGGNVAVTNGRGRSRSHRLE